MRSHEDQLDLAGICWHWGDAYSVTLSEGVWTAIPDADASVTLTADTADDLRALIRRDYQDRTSRPAPLLRERTST